MYPLAYKILSYYLFKQFILRKKIKSVTENEHYQTVTNLLAQYEYPEITKTQSIKETSFTIFDLETTGFFPTIGDEVLSIGAIKVNQDNITYPEQFYEVIQPMGRVSSSIRNLVGLTKQDIRNGKSFIEGLENFLDFSSGTVLVAYPAKFDVPFLQQNILRLGLPEYRPISIDLQRITSYIHPKRRTQLDSILELYNIDKKERHHALNDAYMTTQLFYKIVEELEDRNIKNMTDLIKLQKSLENK